MGLYGIDWDAPLSCDADESVNAVIIPSTDCPLSGDDFARLRREVDPLQQCEDYGISQYLDTVHFVHVHCAA